MAFFELINGHIIKVESTRKFSFFKILRYNRDDVIVFYPSRLFPTSSERLLWLLLKYPFHEKREGWLWLAFLTMTIQIRSDFLKLDLWSWIFCSCFCGILAWNQSKICKCLIDRHWPWILLKIICIKTLFALQVFVFNLSKTEALIRVSGADIRTGKHVST